MSMCETPKGWLMALRGRTCSNCAWHGYHQDMFGSFPTCESPRTRYCYVDNRNGISECQMVVSDVEAYGKWKCKWKEAER